MAEDGDDRITRYAIAHPTRVALWGGLILATLAWAFSGHWQAAVACFAVTAIVVRIDWAQRSVALRRDWARQRTDRAGGRGGDSSGWSGDSSDGDCSDGGGDGGDCD